MIIGLVGRRDDGSSAEAGKDAVADVLVREFSFVRVALADELKRIAQRLWGFSDEQMWGALRNVPDERYPREHGPWTSRGACACCGLQAVYDDMTLVWFAPRAAPQCYLTPRFALQHLGTEGVRAIHEDTWVSFALHAADRVLVGGAWYTPQRGFFYAGKRPNGWPDKVRGVVIPDVRWPAGSEGRRIREVGGHLWRIDRPGVAEGVQRAHASERQEAPDEVFACVIKNDGTLGDLAQRVRQEFFKDGLG